MGKLILTGNSRIRSRGPGAAAAAPPFAPTDVTGLHTWYDASVTADITKNGSDQVSVWAAHGGHGTNLGCTATNAVKSGINTQNGLNVVTFASGIMVHSTPFMYAALAASGAITIFIVANATTTSGTSLETFVTEVNTADASSQLCFRAQTLSSPSNEFIASGAKVGTGQFLTAGSGTGVVGGGARIMMFKLDASPTPDTWSARVDKAAGNSGTFTTNNTVIINQFNVGAMDNSSTPNHFLPGHMCEILVYNVAVAGGDVTSIETYLGTKWGL